MAGNTLRINATDELAINGASDTVQIDGAIIVDTALGISMAVSVSSNNFATVNEALGISETVVLRVKRNAQTVVCIFS
jgi:hypothetical protein